MTLTSNQLTQQQQNNSPQKIAQQDLKSYHGNQNLLLAGEPYQYTQWEVQEFARCANDMDYFVDTYVKIINVDQGLIPFPVWGFQRKLMQLFRDNRYVIAKLPRQCGKSTTTVAFILWYVLFNKDVKVAILAHRADTAQSLFQKLRTAYEHLPLFLQAGIAAGGWNKRSMTLGNGSMVKADATSGGSIRGESFNCVTGDTEIQLNISGQVSITTLKDLYEAFSTKQIHQMVLRSDRKKKSLSVAENSLSNGMASHQTQSNWGNGSTGKFDIIESQGAYLFASPFAKDDSRRKGEVDFCFYPSVDDNWQTGKNVRIDTRKAEIIHERNIMGNVYSEEGVSTFGRNKGKNSSNINWSKNARGISRRVETFGRNETENCSWKYGQATIGRDEAENFRQEQGKINWIETPKGIWREDFTNSYGAQKIGRLGAQNQSQSRKNSQDSREASWNETFGRIQKKNVRSSQGENSLEQGIEEIKILTEQGWKRFAGIKKSSTPQKLVEITLKNNNTIKCTYDHLIYTMHDGWKKAILLYKEDFVLCDDGNYYAVQKTNIQLKEEYVYDILEVQDCNSFFGNGILVHNCVLLDEFAFVEPGLATEFMNSVFPTISSGTTTKLFVVSTPFGLNHFHDMWESAVKKKSKFVHMEIKWNDIPGRDEKWRAEQIGLIGQRNFNQEYNAEFLGSSNTLISPEKLQQLSWVPPKFTTPEGLSVYNLPVAGHNYAITVDVSRGQGLDYHAIAVVDVTNFPYRLVAIFRSNVLHPTLLPNVIDALGKQYNLAPVLVEVNDIGAQVADMLISDLDYDTVVRVNARPGKGQQIGFGSGIAKVQNGLKTSPATKRIGCVDLKTLIETDKLIIEDETTIKELYHFVADLQSFSAEEGKNDDCVMALVLFGWLSHQRYFRHENIDIRAELERLNEEYMENQITPFGIVDDGLDEVEFDRSSYF